MKLIILYFVILLSSSALNELAKSDNEILEEMMKSLLWIWETIQKFTRVAESQVEGNSE